MGEKIATHLHTNQRNSSANFPGYNSKYFILFYFSTAKHFIYFLIIFYWSIVDLQCCISFCYTAKWISYTYTYIHSFLDSFPIQVITEYWVEFPVLYSRSLLVVYFIYSSGYMSIPISQFIPVPPSPLGNHKFVFCI